MTGEPVNPTPLAETARQAAELEALRRMLTASRGTFSLSIAVCNSPALRDYLIQKLSSDDAAISVVTVPPDTSDVLDAAQGAIRDQKPSALFLVNLEKSLPSSADDHPLLAALNASRELWNQAYACPVVFWLPEYTSVLLSTRARDFWAWRSHQFEFVSESATAAAGVRDRFAGGVRIAARLDADQKRFRMAELEQRIADAGDPPPASLREHAMIWLNELANLFYVVGHLDRAEELWGKALEIDESLGDRAGAGTLYGNLGVVYQTRGDLHRAEEMLRKALEIDEKLGNLEGVARHQANLALMYRERSELEQAEDMLLKALDINEKLGRLEGMADDYGSLGLIYTERGDLDHAEQMHRKALEIDEKLGDLEGTATQYGNLGVMYQVRGDLDRAEEILRKALAIDEKLGYLKGMAIQYGNLGLVYEARGDLDRARKLWTKARDLFDQIGMPHMVAKAQRSIDDVPHADDAK